MLYDSLVPTWFFAPTFNTSFSGGSDTVVLATEDGAGDGASDDKEYKKKYSFIQRL